MRIGWWVNCTEDKWCNEGKIMQQIISEIYSLKHANERRCFTVAVQSYLQIEQKKKIHLRRSQNIRGNLELRSGLFDMQVLKRGSLQCVVVVRGDSSSDRFPELKTLKHSHSCQSRGGGGGGGGGDVSREEQRLLPGEYIHILHVSMLSPGHISSGINFSPYLRRLCRSGVTTPGERTGSFWSVILYGCEIKRTGRDYNGHGKNRELQKWKWWKPTEIISLAPTCIESIFFFFFWRPTCAVVFF